MTMRAKTIALALALIAGAAGAGFWLGRVGAPAIAPAGKAAGRTILYWYDPMSPGQRFDKPGKSPFMDMDLVPRYAEDAAAAGTAGAAAAAPRADTIHIDPAIAQNLGMRLATVERGRLDSAVTAAGSLQYNDRDVAVVQTRAAGFVQRVYARAPGDVVVAGAPLADVLVPDWAAAQREYLAANRLGDAALSAAARQRLLLLGMPQALVDRFVASGSVQDEFTIASPQAGALAELDVREGMTLATGTTVARINGLRTVWMEAAVPEALGAGIRPGQAADVTLAAYAGRRFAGRVVAVLPQLDAASRTLRVRVELANPAGALRPGMSAQVRLSTSVAQSALLVPSEAIIRTGARNLVLVAAGQGHVRPVEVVPGPESGGRTTVLSGLAEGDRVVASGQFLLDSEASLRGVYGRADQGDAQAAPGHPAAAGAAP